MDVHLKFLGFLLQDGALYLPNKRASEVWDTLISNTDACPADREVGVCMYMYVCASVLIMILYCCTLVIDIPIF